MYQRLVYYWLGGGEAPFATGMDVFAEEEQTRRLARATKFGTDVVDYATAPLVAAGLSSEELTALAAARERAKKVRR